MNLSHAAAPMRLTGRTPLLTAEATLTNLPSSVDVTVDPQNVTFGYVGDTVMGRATLELKSRTGAPIFGRVTEVYGTLTGIPTTLNFSTQAGGVYTFDTGGGVLGKVDLELVGGARTPLAGTGDGVRLQDLTGSFYLHARVSNLKKVAFGSTEACSGPDSLRTCTTTAVAELNRTGVGSLQIELAQPKRGLDGVTPIPGQVDVFNATALQLPPNVHVDVTSVTRKIHVPGVISLMLPISTRAAYAGRNAAGNLSSPAGSSLQVHAEQGPPGTVMGASIAPLAADMNLCKAADNQCSGSGLNADEGVVVTQRQPADRDQHVAVP